jgi:hypothetical protein
MASMIQRLGLSLAFAGLLMVLGAIGLLFAGPSAAPSLLAALAIGFGGALLVGGMVLLERPSRAARA